MILSDKSDTQRTGCLRPPNSAKGSWCYCIKFLAFWLRKLGSPPLFPAFMLVLRNKRCFLVTIWLEMVTLLGLRNIAQIALMGLEPLLDLWHIGPLG